MLLLVRVTGEASHPDMEHVKGLQAFKDVFSWTQSSPMPRRPGLCPCFLGAPPMFRPLASAAPSGVHRCQHPLKAQLVFVLFNSYTVFQPPPKYICLQKEPRGEVQPTNKNIIITQFSSAWASPGYLPVLYNSIVSPSRLYLIG